ncbi:hypothetical protein T10_6175 [Trichinella papuae]|uniref:Uncharacterized protein n=1 Tax=Trichinella papuae TaxID=268474 RepID=A0A0V1MYD9_9BILA|nr:hypothetical protein T10_6175 [Trichinella papuae]
MIRHRYGDRYLHNGALEIGFRGLELSEDLLLIGHFIFDFIFTIDLFSNNNLKNKNRINHRLESSAKVSLLTTPCHNAYLNTQESSNAETETGCLHFIKGNIFDILVKYSLKSCNLVQYFFDLVYLFFLHFQSISINIIRQCIFMQ